MSKDIRSFFSVVSKKPGTVSAGKNKRVVSSDEDVIEETPEHSKKNAAKKRKIQVLNSDSESDSPKKKSSKKSTSKVGVHEEKTTKLKPVNIADIFGKSPIKQSKVRIVPEVQMQEATKEQSKEQHRSNRKPKAPEKNNQEHGVPTQRKCSDEDLFDADDFLAEHIDELDKSITEATLQEATKSKSKVETPHKKLNVHHSNDSGIDLDQEKQNRRLLFLQHQSRGTPRLKGMKKIPKGKPDCLKGLCFVRTGVLDSLDESDFKKLIDEHGGRIVHAVSGKVNYIVVGEEPGPAKLAKAESHKIPQISENDLLNMIRLKSGLESEENETDLSDLDGMTDFWASGDVDEGVSFKHETESKNDEDQCGNVDKLNFKKLKGVNGESLKEDNQNAKKENKTEQNADPRNELSKELQVTSKEIKPLKREKSSVPSTNLSWADKYKPTDIKFIIGQQGDSSAMNKLIRWLRDWQKNHADKSKKHPRPSPWVKGDDGSYFKCALLSGPPGVGKTTTATLVAKHLGFDVVEFNASDTRSKKLLHEEVTQLLSTQTLAGFATGQARTSKKRVLLMDEVDGMAGNEDRGGIQELINLIKTTSVPIICMCNDRNHQKMRSLATYCFDLRVPKPRVEQVMGAMRTVCVREGIQVDPKALGEIITGTGCDLRQTLTHLSLLSATTKNLTQEVAEKESKASKKDMVLGPWEVVRMVFNENDQKTMSLSEKARLFFYDYSLGPLFVQENYIRVKPHLNTKGMSNKQAKKATLKQFALAADAISMGDLIDSKIRRSNNWSLLETQAMFSSVLPGHYLSGHIQFAINFPGWLGKNSKRTKHNRMLSEIQIHTRTITQASKLAVRLDYLTPLRNAVLNPLKKFGMDGIEKAVDVMKTYNLLREDVDNLNELTRWSKEGMYAKIDSKVKSAFTRTYNKQVPLLPFAVMAGMSKKKANLSQESVEGDEELVESDNGEEDDDVTADAMIKVKAPPKGKKKTGEPSTSKKKPDSKKGKGKKSK